MALHACHTLSSWPIGTVYRLCRDHDIDITTAVEAAWATALWGYASNNHIEIVSQRTVHGTCTWHRCEATFDTSSTFTSVLRSVHNSTKQMSPPDQGSLSIRASPFLRTATVFTSGALWCASPANDPIHPLSLRCNLSEEILDCAVQYSSDAFDALQAERIGHAFNHAMDVLLSDTNNLLAAIDLINDHDKAELWAWNNTQAPETVNSCAHFLFQQRVAQQPEMLAVDAWDGTFTYQELDDVSTLIAHHLIVQGVGPESTVPLCFDKSCWAIAALWGVIKAGGAMVFIDPANPTSRRREIISQLSADQILTTANHIASWEIIGVRPIVIGRSLVECLPRVGASPRTAVTPESLLYIIFTSGTTSKPKGCLITHRAFLSGALQHAAKSNLSPQSRVLQLASYSFDVSILEIVTSLISGACVCTPDSAAMTQGLASIINNYRISWAFLTPSLVKLIKPNEVPTLQTLILGGEQLHRTDIETWAAHLQLINGYGPSECSIAAAGDPHLTTSSDPANIGRSVGGLMWIVQSENHDKLVPIGAAGELLISGPILARGYLNNPDQTRSAFITDPLWTRSFPQDTAYSHRFYKTGDLARFNSDGTLQFLGRKDTQVKLRGMRIELSEIEHCITEQQNVKHVAVFLPGNGSCKGKLVAVLSLHEFSREANPGAPNASIDVVACSAATAQLDIVQADLASRIPQYMIPAVWIIIEAWPLLASAKLNRKHVLSWLLKMGSDNYHGQMGLLKLQRKQIQLESTEAKLCIIIGRILNIPVDRIPLDKSFLSLGGDSITAMQVAAQCKSEGMSVMTKNVLRSKSIAEIVSSSQQVLKSSFSKDETFDHLFELSPMQRMYSRKLSSVHEELREVQFNQSFYVEVAKPVTRMVVKSALNAVVARHSMLRARFVLQAGEWRQKILSSVNESYRFKCHTLRSLEDASTIAMISQRTVGLAGPVFSVDVFQLGEEQYLFMVAHHAVIDWVSWRTILRDLETFISTGTLGGEPPMPFQNWINLQAAHASQYGNPLEVLPFTVPSPDFGFWDVIGKPNTLSETTTTVFNLDNDLTAQLLGGEPHQALRTETLDFLLASLLYSFSQIFKDRSLPAIFREGHGREPWDPALDIADTVGWFTTIYPLAIVADSGEDVISFLKKVKDVRHSVPDNGRPYFASQFYYDEAIEQFQNHDLVEIAFDYLGQFQALEREDAILRQGVRPSFIPQSDDVGKHLDRFSLIEITVEVVNRQLQYSFVYNKHMKHQARIEAWIKGTEHTLSNMIAQMLTAPFEFTLADFPLLSMSYEGLNRLMEEILPKASCDSLENIEEILPCSPMQQGLLLSQSLSHNGVYQYIHRFEVTSAASTQRVDADRLANAWTHIVQRHQSLRTVFIESSAQTGLFDQIILKSIVADVKILTCTEHDVEDIFRSQQPISYRSTSPPHRLTIACVAIDRLVAQLEINHAVVDGSSIANIVQEIGQFYEGASPAQSAFRYSDYVRFIRDGDVAMSTEYWKKYLNHQHPCILPDLAQLERPVAEKSVNTLNVDVSSSTQALKAFCDKLNITPLSLFQVAWGLVLGIYTESSRVCFGYLSSGRDVALPNIENGVGPFMNMLVCSLDLSEGNLSALLQRTAEDLMKSLPHEVFGLAHIQHVLQMGNTPLFNTILSFHRENFLSEFRTSEIIIRSLSTQDPTEYALGLDIGLFKNTIEVSIQFWTDHITKEQAFNIGTTFDKVLTSILESPDAVPASLDCVSQIHVDQMVRFNGNGEPLPTSNRLMFAAMRDWAETSPDAEAICSWEGSWTYKELDDITNRLGHHLRAIGVGPEIIVPHIFQKSAWAVITMISILKAGGAFVGLDWGHPRQRLEMLISEVDATIVCASPDTAGIVQGMAQIKELIVIEPQAIAKLPAKDRLPCPEVKPCNLACVVFSSGTTAKPKTIAMEHASISTMSDLMGPPFRIGRKSRVFQFAAYAYDTSNHDIFVTLQRGGCVCIPSEDERMNNPASAIRRMNVNWAALTPTVARLLEPDKVPSLQFISCGGEPLDRELVRTWAGKVDLVNGYGPAETAVSSSLSAPLTLDSSPSNIGPSYGARAWIVDIDDYNRLVPLGASGELLLEGPQLARCYLKDIRKTAAAFVHNPKWAQVSTPGLNRRFYRTGDICRFNLDGTLSIMGRRDTMVKVNGQRVELEGVSYQIQSELLQLGKHATVINIALPLKNNSRSLSLVAFLSYEESQSASSALSGSLVLDSCNNLILLHVSLRSALEARLPRFMIPSMFIPITHVPLTRNGKLDTTRLHDEVLHLSDDEMAKYSLQNVAKRAPETPAEIILQALWSEVLRKPAETFGVNDDFIRAGGDSIGAMKLVAAARARHLTLSVSDIFRYPRFSDMALKLTSREESCERQAQETFDLIGGFEPTVIEEIKSEAISQCGVQKCQLIDLYPCTALQEGLMALSNRLGKGTYKAQKVFRITKENFDITGFKKAWASISASEDILRTRIVHTKAAGTLQAVVDTDIQWHESAEELESYLTQDLESPTLYGQPLLRLALITSANTSYFIWSAHHAVYDGWSATLIIEKLRQAMVGLRTHARPAPYKAFIRYITSVKESTQRTFWAGQFQDNQTLPIGFPSVPFAYRTKRSENLEEVVSIKVKLAEGSNITTPSILRAAWASVLSKYSGSKDVIFGSTLSGRTTPVSGIFDMIGPTIATIPVRVRLDLPEETSGREYLRTVQEQAMAMVPFEQMGLQNIRRQCSNARFAVDGIANLLVIQPYAPEDDGALPDMEAIPRSLEDFDNYPLVLSCFFSEDGTASWKVKFDPAIIPRKQMQRIMNQYDHTIRQLCSKPDAKLKDINTMSLGDMYEITKWNGPLPEPMKACIHHVIAARTKEGPKADAICAWDGDLTYAELDSISNKLAAHLQSLDVGPDVKIGLCFDKSKWNAVAMLSVLKAGGVYTQLNPASPQTALKGILSDLGASLVVCSSQHAGLFTEIVTTVLPVDSAFMFSLAGPLQTIRSNTCPESTAFIVYTSGSTGKPKGVLVDHRGFCSMVEYQAPQLGVGQTTRVLQFASHWFDISNADTFLTLMRGGCVCIPSEDERLTDLSGAINKYNANWATMVPTAAAVLRPEEVPTLTHLSLGGEAVRQDLHQRWNQRVVLMNSFGPAECSVLTTMGLLTQDVCPQNIGKGLGCRTWITEKDNHHRLASIGCIGELCVEGPIVTRGYHNNDITTAGAYISNPEFAEAIGLGKVRIYKTGDLVRYEPDGSLYFVGRKDTQIKIHGRRIECGEIEHHIVANGFGVDNVVVERIFEGGDDTRPVLAAFIKVDKNSETDLEQSLTVHLSSGHRIRFSDLRRKLENVVQPYLVPTLFVPVHDIPLTTTGKKDRKRLREVGTQLCPSQMEQYRLMETISRDDDVRHPFKDSEFFLACLWGEVLGLSVESIQAQDNFLQKGGDSVRAVALASAVIRSGKTLTVSDIFRHPQLSEMAECLQERTAAYDIEVVPFSMINNLGTMIDHAAHACHVHKDKIQDIIPCTPLQEGLMAISTRTTNAYVAIRVFEIAKSVDIVIFKQAWERAVQLFPILRTRIILGPDMESLQVVLDESLTWGEINGSVKTYLAQSGLSQIEYGRPLSAYALSRRSRRFVWTCHHSLYDGNSAAQLLSTVEKLYKGITIEATPNFNKFIRYLTHVNTDESDEFWREKLSGGSPSSFPILPSSTYHPRPNSELFCSFTIPQCDASDIVKATILRAAWSLVTARYVESSDIVYGETLAGRNVPVDGIAEIVGPCFTTVPIRQKIDEHQSVGHYLHQIQDDSVAIIPFQHRGLQSLRRLGSDVHPSLEFYSLFEVHDGNSSQSTDCFTEIPDKELLKDFFELYAVVMECIIMDHKTVKIELRYDKNVMDNWQMERFCNQFKHVVQQLCIMSPGKPLTDIEIVSSEDITTLLSWNHKNNLQQTFSVVHDLIAEQVQLHPKIPAISGWDGEITYEQLDDFSTRVARALSDRGIGRGDIVPMCFEKSKWAVVAALGILKAGGAVAQLGISHPISWKIQILEDTSAKILVTSNKQQASFDGIIDTFVVDERTNFNSLSKTITQLPLVVPSDAAYVLFTSGSTGRPKGIVVDHVNLCTSSRHHGDCMGINLGTRVFQYAAYTFDVSCADIFTSLQRGATVCVPSEEERINDLSEAITKYGADWVFLTPTVAQMIEPSSVPNLRTLVLGGEAPTQKNIKTWTNHLQLILVWGPAETTIYATSTPPTTIETSPATLGSPMGCNLWLCEPGDHNKLAPVGCVGEILVEGGLVSRGYLNNAEQANAAYIRNPRWANIDESSNQPRRMYKTGDLGRWNSDGILQYVGRKDNQVRLHGQRLELGDIEFRISRHMCVQHAVTRIPRSGPFKGRLVATLSFHTSPSLQEVKNESYGSDQSIIEPLSTREQDMIASDLATIRSDLQHTLPAYQNPSVWISVKVIPLNGSGKIDRKSVNKWLEEMDPKNVDFLIQGTSTQSVVQPSTPEEKSLSKILSSILNLQHPDLRQSFLSLGGDSITAMQLRARARADGMELTIKDILKSKSISALAIAGKSSALTSFQMHQEQVGSYFNLSPIQELFLRTTKLTTHFNQNVIVKINSFQLAEQVESAIQSIVSRHSMLRARFRQTGDTWSQYITHDIQSSYAFQIDQTENRDQVSGILAQRKDLNMDISSGPLLIVHLFNVSQEQEQLLFMSAHHLLVDSVSWRIILSDLQTLLTTGTLLPDIPLSFQDWLYSQDHDKSLSSGEETISLATPDFRYWHMEDLDNVFGDVLNLNLTLSEALTARIFGSINQRLNTEPVDIFLATVVHSFRALFNDRQSPPIFVESHGRKAKSNDIDPNGTVGWFTRIDPVDFASSQSDIIKLIRLSKDSRRQSSRDKSYLSSVIDDEKSWQKGMARRSPFELLFNYLGKMQQLEGEQALFSEVDLERDAVSSTQYDPRLERLSLIDIAILVSQGQARVNFAYNKRMNDQEKLRQWPSVFKKSIELAIETLESTNQQHTLSDFPLLPNLDERKLADLQQNIVAQGISMTNVEDIFPCVPLQQHILNAQETDPGCSLYAVSICQQVLSAGQPSLNGDIDLRALQSAWVQVVNYHAILRTIFVHSLLRPGQHEQVVLRSYETDVSIIVCSNEIDMLARTKRHRTLVYNLLDDRPQHRFTLFTTKNGQKTTCKLEINHALVDGKSMQIIFRDLTNAYRSQLNTSHDSPYFGDYVSWLAHQNSKASVEYWRDFINRSTQLSMASGPLKRGERKSLNIELGSSLVEKILSFSKLHGITIAAFFQCVWALVLRQNCEHFEQTPFFGYMVANRDAAVYRATEMVGPMTTMLLCKVECTSNTRVSDLLHGIQNQTLEAMQHQAGLADAVRNFEIKHANGVGETSSPLRLCNSVMSLQYVDTSPGVAFLRKPSSEGSRMALGLNRSSGAKTSRISSNMASKGEYNDTHSSGNDETKGLIFQLLSYEDPNEYDMSVGVQIVRSATGHADDLQIKFGLAYWSGVLHESKARSNARAFQRCAEKLVEDGSSGLRLWMIMRQLE